VCVWTLGEMIASPHTGAFVAHLAPEQYRGRYNGLWVFAWASGLVIGPSLGTWTFQRSPNALWIACGVLAFASAGLAQWKPK
jgi:MFS family permease